MLIEGDVTGLEVVGVAYLSQDRVLCEEIRNGEDIHGNNQQRFGFIKGPKGRLVAKIFKFRLIYGGSAYAYAHDPDFNWISSSVKYWQKIIDTYYDKYQGIYIWHNKIYEQALMANTWVSPTGRRYVYEPYKNNRGEWEWPRTKILNYPVQGLGADLMTIARLSAKRRLGKRLSEDVLFINTVHDSILLDSPKEVVYPVCSILEGVFTDIPKNFMKIFKVPFNLPMRGEVKFGHNWKDMEKYKGQ